MKMLMAAAVLVLSTSAAMAEAPCQNPVLLSCQKACAAMGAKLVLTTRKQNMSVRPVRASDADSFGTLEDAERLARLSGLSLAYIDGLTVREVRAAIAGYCPRS